MELTQGNIFSGKIGIQSSARNSWHTTGKGLALSMNPIEGEFANCKGLA